MNVAHVITGLNTGGAEIMLRNLVTSPDYGHESQVFSLGEIGSIGATIVDAGIPVIPMNLRPSLPDPRAVTRLAHEFRTRQIDHVQTWMYHADFFGGLAARRAGLTVSWGLHHNDLYYPVVKRTTLLMVRLNAHLSSRVPNAIVCCAVATKATHDARGYDREKTLVIENGFDTKRFQFDPTARHDVRRELGLGDDTPLVAQVARFSTVKGHDIMVRAMKLVLETMPNARFLFCGTDLDDENTQMRSWLREAGVEHAALLLGQRTDIQRIMSAVDVVCQPSIGEAFSLTVGEAMAIGAAIVATDVGDTAAMLGDTGIVVPPRNEIALAAALVDLLGWSREKRAALGELARQRVTEKYNLPRIARRYRSLHSYLVDNHGERLAAWQD